MKKFLTQSSMFLVFFLIMGTVRTLAQTPIGELPVNEDFENGTGIFSGGEIYNNDAVGNVLRINNTTSTATFGDAGYSIGSDEKITFSYTAYHGWLSKGKSAVFSITNTDGNELASYEYNLGSCEIASVKIGGSVIDGFTAFGFNGLAAGGAGTNGFDNGRNQGFTGDAANNPKITITISGSGFVTLQFVVANKDIEQSFSGMLAEGTKLSLGNITVSNPNGNDDRAYAIDNFSITSEKSAEQIATYGIQRVCGQSVLSTEELSGVVGTTPAISESAYYDAENGNKKYIYESNDAETIGAIAADNGTVYTITYREAAEWSYTVNAVDDAENILEEGIAAGKAYEGETVKVPFRVYYNNEGTLFQTSPISSEYNLPVELTEDNLVKTLTYKATDKTDVVFYSEAEVIDGMTLTNNANTKVRSSFAASAYAAEQNVKVTSLKPGKYVLTAVLCTPQGAGGQFTFLAGDKEIGTVASTGNQNWVEGSTEEFTLNAETDIMLAPGGGNNAGVDFIYIRKTGDVEAGTSYAVGKINILKLDVPTSSSSSTDGDILEDKVLTEADFTVTVSPKSKGSTENRFWETTSGPELRVYSGTITVKAAAGKKLDKIVFGQTKWGKMTADNGTLDEQTWTGDAETVVFTVDEQCRITSVTVGDYVEPVAEVGTIAELKALTKDTEAKLALNGTKVTFVSGKNVYIEDETGGVLLYDSGLELTAGKALTGYIYGKYTLFNSIPELTATEKTSTSEYTEADAEIVPTEMTVADLLAGKGICQLVKVKDVTVDADLQYLTQGEDVTTIYDKFKVLPDGYTYPEEIESMVVIAETYAVYPVSADLIIGKSQMPEGVVTLVHTAGTRYDAAATEANTVDAEFEYYNNDANASWVGYAFAEFSYKLPAGAVITKATLTWTGTTTDKARDNKIYYLNEGVTLDYDAILATQDNYRFADQKTFVYNENFGGEKTCETDVTKAVQDMLTKQDYIIFQWTGNAGAGKLYGKGSADKAPVLVIETKTEADMADYKVIFVDADGNELKASDTRSGVKDGAVTLEDADKADFFNEDKTMKYIYVSDDAADQTVAADGSTVVKVVFREAQKIGYTLTAADADGNELKTIATGEDFEKESIAVPFSHKIAVDGVLYETSAINKEYRYSITLTEAVSTTIQYVPTGITGVVFCEEAENIEGMTPCDNANTVVRSSNAGSAYAAENDVTLTTLQPGKYILTAVICTPTSSGGTFTFMAGETEIGSVSQAGNVNWTEGSTEEFSVEQENTPVILKAGGSNLKGVDYVFIQKTGTYDGITEITADGAAVNDVYTVSGVKVRSAGESVDGLAKGIYVVGGKKVVLK